MINYLIGVGAFFIVIYVFYRFIKNSRNDKGQCSCGCKGCFIENQCGHNK